MTTKVRSSSGTPVAFQGSLCGRLAWFWQSCDQTTSKTCLGIAPAVQREDVSIRELAVAGDQPFTDLIDVRGSGSEW